jgi:hypothetical protein
MAGKTSLWGSAKLFGVFAAGDGIREGRTEAVRRRYHCPMTGDAFRPRLVAGQAFRAEVGIGEMIEEPAGRVGAAFCAKDVMSLMTVVASGLMMTGGAVGRTSERFHTVVVKPDGG